VDANMPSAREREGGDKEVFIAMKIAHSHKSQLISTVMLGLMP